jgi:hypothetical protein
VAQKNTIFKVADIQRLIHAAVDNIQVSAWVACVHAKKLQEYSFKKMTVRDGMLELSLQISDLEESKSSSEDG